jgi:hypothetical protein
MGMHQVLPKMSSELGLLVVAIHVNNSSSLNFRALMINLDKNGLGYILDNFFSKTVASF